MNGTTYIPSYLNISQMDQKLLGGKKTHTQA